MPIPALTDGEFALLKNYVKDLTTIDLDDTKKYLIETRLGPLLDPNECANYATFYRKCKDDKSGKLPTALINAITTNETYFFRDKKPFHLLKTKLLPDLLGTNPERHLRILSAACSTGQEAYSMAITIKEILFDLSQCNIQITGVDISDNVVIAAQKGTYSTFEVNRGLEPDVLAKNFTQTGNLYKINDDLRALCNFRKANLFTDLPYLGKFHIIFCRNVAIYFTPDKKTQLFETLANQLEPGGALVIGSTETLLGITDRFKRMEFQAITYYV